MNYSYKKETKTQIYAKKFTRVIHRKTEVAASYSTVLRYLFVFELLTIIKLSLFPTSPGKVDSTLNHGLKVCTVVGHVSRTGFFHGIVRNPEVVVGVETTQERQFFLNELFLQFSVLL